MGLTLLKLFYIWWAAIWGILVVGMVAAAVKMKLEEWDDAKADKFVD